MRAKIALLAVFVVILTVAAVAEIQISGNVVKNGAITKVSIGWLPLVHSLPLFVAVEKGYFREAGIDAEMVRFDSPNQMVDAMMQGSVDFGSANAPLGIIGIADFKNPGKIKIFALSGGSIDNPNENLLVRNDSNITSIKDLVGKRLGILGSSIQWSTIANELLNQSGLEMDKDVTVVGLTNALQIQALASGQIDALLALEPTSTIAIEKGIGKVISSAPVEREIANPFWPGAAAVNTRFARDNPETANKVMGIIKKAIKEINQNPNAYRQYLAGYTPLDNSTILDVPIVDFKVCEDFTQNDIEAMDKFFSIFEKHGVVDGKINSSGLIYCGNSSEGI